MNILRYIFVLLFLCSCETIRFVNHNPADLSSGKPSFSYDDLHHIGLFGMHEYSKPVDIDKICGSKQFIHAETYIGIKEYAISYAKYLLVPILISQVSFPEAPDISPSGILIPFLIYAWNNIAVLFPSTVTSILYSPRSVKVMCR